MKISNFSILISACIASNAFANNISNEVNYGQQATLTLSDQIKDRISEIRNLAKGENNIIYENNKRFIAINGTKYELTNDNNILFNFPIPFYDTSTITNAFDFIDSEWEVTWNDGGATFVNKRFGNYNYGNGCLIEYYPSGVDILGKKEYLITKTASCKNNDITIKNVVSSRSDKFSIPVSNDPALNINASVNSIVKMDTPFIYKFQDINVSKTKDGWLIKNKTPIPISRLPIRINKNKTVVLNFDNDIPEYNKAYFNVDLAEAITSIELIQQTVMFLPNVNMQTDDNPCAGNTGLCYEGPKNQSERNTYDITLINIHNAFNRQSFYDSMDVFFQQNCGTYPACGTFEKPEDYTTNRFLQMGGVQGHNLGMKVMRNGNFAEGVAGGVGTNPADFYSSSGGWVAIKGQYIDEDSPYYRYFTASYYNIMFHEISHVYGNSHTSGMTYGFSDLFSTTYLTDFVDRYSQTKRGTYQVPGVLMDYTLIEDRKLRIELTGVTPEQAKNINLHITSANALNYNLEYNETIESGVIYVNFLTAPTATVYIRASVPESDIVATIKFAPEHLLMKETDFVPVSLFKDENQSGNELKISANISDLSVYQFENAMSSFNIPEGYTVRFYEGTNYTGGYYSRTAQTSNASGFNDKINSISLLSTPSKMKMPTITLPKLMEVTGGERIVLTANDTSVDYVYNWSLPASFSMISGEGTSEITVDVPIGDLDTYLVSLSISNSINTSPISTMVIKVNK